MELQRFFSCGEAGKASSEESGCLMCREPELG
jgi:hypothetical protein